MAGKSHEEAPVYEEFEPFCVWRRREDRDVLEIHLQDFKKDQLTVRICNHDTLKIFGERQLEASTRSKFHKETPLPSNTYNTQAFQAKFIKGCLYITMPKFNPETNGKITSSSETSKIDQTAKSGLAKDQYTVAPPPQDSISGGAMEQQTPPSGVNAPSPEFEFHKRNHPSSETRPAKVGVRLAAMTAAVAVLVAYVVNYMYKSG